MLSDAELVCLAVMQVLLRFPSERHWLRYARKHLAGRPGMMFPYLPDQDGYNKRMRTAGPLLARVMRHLATRSPVVVGPVAVDRFHPGAVCGVPGDR